jgi:hypothetical protein
MSEKPDPSDKKTARQEKLAAALRANLQRRKAAKRAATAAKKEAE